MVCNTLKSTSTLFTVLIWYTGHGEVMTGNWVFPDGFLKFEDLYNLYKKHFTGRYLYIVTDCCHSGAWVVECARLLDNDDIKCFHAAKENKVYIKVFAACLPDEKAYDRFYTKCKGVKLYDSKKIVFAKHRKLYLKDKDKKSQTTFGVDFTRNDGCVVDHNGKCHCHTWTKNVKSLLKQSYSYDYLI